MRKFLLTLTIVTAATFVSKAQEFGFQKLNVFVEGSFSYNTVKDKNTDTEQTTYSFTPKVGNFLTDKIAVGVYANIAQAQQQVATENYEFDFSMKSVEIGAFGRYYFFELGERFKTYTELSAGYLSAKAKGEDSTPSTPSFKLNGFNANAGIGANYFLTDKIALNFAFANLISFANVKADTDGAKSVSSFGLNINNFDNFFQAASFGLTFKF